MIVFFRHLSHRFRGLGWALLLLLPAASSAARVEIRDGHFYVDNEPFYIRAVGYAPWRPHQHPGISYANTNRHWTLLDFARIKAAHFNTLRTWAPLAPAELALAQQYDLWVIQGIGLDTQQDFSDPRNQDNAVAQARSVAEQTKAAENVLGYLLMNEPRADVVLNSGASDTLRFLRRLKRTIQSVDARPVSLASWLPLAFLDHHDFDFIACDAFAFWPTSVNHSLGYPGYVQWLADRLAPDRPFILSETGGYAVSPSSQSRAGGFGGLSEYDQSVRDVQSLRQAVQGHAHGTTLVSWIDTWFYPRDADTHDDEPWEWNGLLAIPTDDAKALAGQPRQVLQDVTVYNEAIILEPKADHLYAREKPIAIDVVTADNVQEVRYSVNGDDWHVLTGSGHGRWQGFFRLPRQARKRQRLALQALDKESSTLSAPEVSFLTAVTPEHVAITPQSVAGAKDALGFRVALTDDTKHPIARRKVDYGCFYPVTLRESSGTGTTDVDGRLVLQCALAPQADDRYLYVSAGTESPEHVRAGDMRIFPLGQ